MIFFFLIFLLLVLWYQLNIVEGLTPPPIWGNEETMDYPGNDIANTPNISLNDCKQKCITDKTCKGIVTDFSGDGPGNCWTKNAFGTSTAADNRFAYKLPNR